MLTVHPASPSSSSSELASVTNLLFLRAHRGHHPPRPVPHLHKAREVSPYPHEVSVMLTTHSVASSSFFIKANFLRITPYALSCQRPSTQSTLHVRSYPLCYADAFQVVDSVATLFVPLVVLPHQPIARLHSPRLTLPTQLLLPCCSRWSSSSL